MFALKSKSYIVITSDNKEEGRRKGHDYNFTSDEYKYVAFKKNVSPNEKNNFNKA